MDQKSLLRDCEATLIPAGDRVKLPMGTAFNVTHRLGGNFTILTDYGMFRIDAHDADALGETSIADANETQSEGVSKVTEVTDHQGPPEESVLWEKLKEVFDPEIPVNIVDLGLIYSLDILELEAGQYGVHANMTLTAPGCGMGPVIADDAKKKLLTAPGVSSAHVEIVWDPPWHQELISEEGKMQLGLI